MTETTSNPVKIVNRPVGIAMLTIAMLVTGGVIGNEMAKKSPRQAMREALRAQIERELDRKYSDENFNFHAYANVSNTNDLVRKIRSQPDDRKQILNEQLFSNIYRLSSFKTTDNFEETTIEYELWISLDLLGVSSISEFESHFDSSEVFEKCRDYFGNRPDGQEHYSKLLSLVGKALTNAELHQQVSRKGASGG